MTDDTRKVALRPAVHTDDAWIVSSFSDGAWTDRITVTRETAAVLAAKLLHYAATGEVPS